MIQSNQQVPTYQNISVQAKKNVYCVFVFVINEGARIRAQLAKMATYADQIDIIVADGGSTDGSLDENYLKSCGVTTLLIKTGAGKLSAQMRMAFDFALKNDYQGVVVMDGNNKDDVTAIPRFISALQAGYDHIQGSRFIPGGQAINTPLSRHLGLKLLHAPLIAWASGFHYTDTTNGFRAYSRRLLEHPQIQPLRSVFMQYELHYYLAIRAAKLGLRITEVAVTRTYPAKGKTPTKISSVRGNFLILMTLFKAVTHQYNPKEQG